MEIIYDTVIIGGGPAGYTAALYASRAGLDTLVIEKMSAGGQMALTGEIDNYPGFPEGVDGFTLGANMQAAAERFGAKTEYAEVLSLELAEKVKKIITSSKTVLAKTVIIATGAEPRELGIKSEKELVGKGVHYCAHCDGRFYKGKTVAVVGGGNSAVSDALYLSRLAKKVYLVHRRDTLRATKIYLDPLKKSENIEFLFDSALIDIIAQPRVTQAKIKDLKNGKENYIDCDGIFISIGRTPTTAFLNGAVPLDPQGYIIADESTRTSIDGVFAAGDVRTKTLRQIVTAVSDGAIAASASEEYISVE
ncbi:MAG: thioredoxin-disulfide reductase [Clostridia bacterium]|nr:thioredoxin-disulfide reductase [Clostridia bacterium]